MTRKWISLFLIYLIGITPTLAFALPQDGQVVAGTGTIGTSAPGQMVINQNSSQMITNWQSFSVGSTESVTFTQPGANATSLNRVIGTDPSHIMGRISANGQVFLSNPSGILFGAGSVVNAHGLVATTLGISNQDFLDRNYNFTQDPTKPLAAVVNQGRIETSGFAGLLAPAVSNEGAIIANLGSVALGAGEAATLDFNGDGLIKFAITQETTGEVRDTEGNVLQDRVNNTGHIQANGGQVMLTARDAGNVIRNVINNEGVIEARSVVEQNGRIFLMGGDTGVVSNSGTLDVSGTNAGETGGQIVVLGEKVGMFDEARVDASGSAGGGEILLGGEQLGATAIEGETNADMLYIHDDVEINADAIDSGDGGRIITWATDTNRAFGSIYARGGAQSGNGGFVEISGGRYFEIGRIPDVTAANGQAGHWLIDPAHNLNIVPGGGNTNINATNPFATTADTASLGWDLIKSFLTGGATVTVQTTPDGLSNENGDINVNTILDYNGTGTGNTLIFNAEGDITFNNKIFDSSGTDDILNLQLFANGGAITFNDTGNVISGRFDATTVDGSAGVFTLNGDLTITGAGSSLDSAITAYDYAFNSNLNYNDTNQLSLIQRASSPRFGVGTTNCQTTFCETMIDNAELNRINVPSGTLKLTANSKMFVKDVASSNTDQINKLVLQGAQDIEFESGTGSTFKDVELRTVSDVLVNSDLTTTVFLDSKQSLHFIIASGKTLTSTTGGLEIFTDDIDIQGNINTGTAQTKISTNSSSNDIFVGAGGGGLDISNAEIANITAGTLRLGDFSLTDDIVFDGVSSASFANISSNTFANAGDLIFFLNSASSFKSIGAIAGGSVIVTQNVSTTAGNIDLVSGFGVGTGSIDINGGVLMSSFFGMSLNANESQINTFGNVTLNTDNGLQLSSNTNIGGLFIANTDTNNNGGGIFSVASGKTLNSSSGNHSVLIFAPDVALSGNVNTGTGEFRITASNGHTVGIGTSTGQLTIDGGELSRINSGLFRIENSNNTTTVNGVTGTQVANIANADLRGDQINIGTGGAVFKQLTLSGQNGANINGNVTTTVGGLIVAADSDEGNDGVITLGSGVTLDSANTLEMHAQFSGTGMVGAGGFTLRAANGIEINPNVVANGVVNINADTITQGDGVLTTSGNINSMNNNININADDVELGGNLNSGTANINIAVSDTEELNVGGIGGMSMNLDNSELSSIFANQLSLFANNRINVDDLTLTTVNKLILNSTEDIRFTGSPSTVTSLEANAARHVIFQENLTATQGDLTFRPDSDGNGVGDMLLGSGVSINSNGNDIHIRANDYKNAPTFTLNAGLGSVFINISDGGTIGLGEAGCLNGCDMHLSNTELANILANSLIIGNFNSGNVFINSVSPLAVANILSGVTINSGNHITFAGGASTFPALFLNANTNINVLTNVTTTQGSFFAIADFNNNSFGQFILPEDITITSAGDINIRAAQILDNGEFNAAGSVILFETFPLSSGGFNSGTQSTFLTNFLKNAAAGCS